MRRKFYSENLHINIYSSFLTLVWGMMLLLGLASCSKGEYYNAMPKESTAFLRVDGKKLVQTKMSNKMEFFFSMMGIEGLKDTGIDFTQPVYFFESTDGNIGICAAMDDNDKMDEFIKKLKAANSATEPEEKKDAKFSVVRGSWIFGYTKDAVLIMGPVVSADQSQQEKRMARYLELDEDHGAGSSELFQTLDENKSEVALIAKASSLPKQMITPFLIGTPSGTSGDDIIIQADMHVDGETMILNGKTSSQNVNIDQNINKAMGTFKPLSCDVAEADSGVVMSIYLNSKGTDFLNLMKQNAELRDLLGNSEFSQKVAKINGNMLITLMSGGVDGSQYRVDVKALPDNGKAEEEHLKILVNLSGFKNESMFGTISMLLGSVNKLEYLMK